MDSSKAYAEEAREAPRVSLEREKPRQLGLSLASRAYRLTRSLLPRQWLTHKLLNGAWILRRLAWEQIWFWLPPETALGVVRPESRPFIRSSIPEGCRVIDLGGGSGLASLTAAEVADEVVYVDRDPANVASARITCGSCPNVTFIEGDALTTLEERSPFDVALILHLLGYLDDPESVLARLREHCQRLVIEVSDMASDPLNYARLREKLPVYSDADHVTEFTEPHLTALLFSSGWRIEQVRSVSGAIFAVADRP